MKSTVSFTLYCAVVQSIGYTPVYRPGLDGGLRTVVQTKGFPTAGVMTGYRFYAQIIRNLQVGLYRPQGSCRYQLIKGWTRAVINEGMQTVGCCEVNYTINN